MGALQLHAIGVDEVRDLFSASPQAAAAFRAIVAPALPREQLGPAPGLLGKLGPLFRKPLEAPILRPDTPVEADVADLLAGRFIRPERQQAVWQLMEAWLAGRSWGGHLIDLDQQRFNDLEFDLARAGVPARYGLGALVNTELGIPLQHPRGLSTGATRYPHVLEARDAWADALDRLSPQNRAIAEPYVAWLDGFPRFDTAAAAAGRPTPDLVTIYRAAATVTTPGR